MALLALTLALLAITVATEGIMMKRLDMALDSFDDRYQGCGPEMKAVLPALNRSEFQNNPLFAQVWVKAAAEWQRRGPPVTPLSSTQANALMAFMMNDLHEQFNNAVRIAGQSHQAYRERFHFKVLHFLLTNALATLRDTQRPRCHRVTLWECGVWFEARLGDTVRFGQFMSTLPRKAVRQCSEMLTIFHVNTCHSVEIQEFSYYPILKEVLIPPFETFEVIHYIQERDRTEILLHSTGTYSKYNCEWLQGGSVPRAPFHLGGLLLATTALAVATGIL